MSVKRYKIGFRSDINGALDFLFDGGEMVMACEYDRLKTAVDEARWLLSDATLFVDHRFHDPKSEQEWHNRCAAWLIAHAEGQ